MKKLKTLFYAIAFAGALTSCSDTLDLTPEDYYASGNFWKTQAQFDGFMIGLHNSLRGDYSNIFVLGEARGGTQKNGTSTMSTSLNYSSPIKNNAFTKDQTGVSGWASYYGRILQVNLFIQKAEAASATILPDATKNYLLGQAYGLRAYYYFQLYKTFGGVPIVTEPMPLATSDPTKLSTARSTPKQTLDFIKQNVEKSEQYFANDNFTLKNKRAMWSKAATLVLKGEVYLWSAKVTTGDQTPTDVTGDLAKAETALLAVKNSGKFGLLSKFEDVFSTSNKGNNEIILALRFADGEATNNTNEFVYQDAVFLGQYTDITGKKVMKDTLNLKGTGGVFRNEYKFELFDSYDDADARKRATFLDYYKVVNGTPTVKAVVLRKFVGSINSTNNRVYDSDIPVYRYADVLLLLAEVANKKGEDPSGYINDIRKRAYGPTYPVYANGSFEENELAILKERDKEFVWEGKRWYDLCRMQDGAGKPLAFSAAANYPATAPVLLESEAFKLLWPIDVNTLNADPLLKDQQNPGY